MRNLSSQGRSYSVLGIGSRALAMDGMISDVVAVRRDEGMDGSTYNVDFTFAAIVNWHVAALARIVFICSQLTHEVFDGEASL